MASRGGARRQRRHRAERESCRRRGRGEAARQDVLVAGVAGLVAGALSMAARGYVSVFNSSGGSIGAVALFRGALDTFISSPVAAPLPNVMGHG